MTSRKAFIFCFLFLVASLAGCSNKLSGELTINDDGKSLLTFTPEECESAVHSNHTGVILYYDDAEVKALALTKGGYGVFIKSDELGEEVRLNEEQCSQFEVVVKPQSSSVNDVQNVEGKIQLTCQRGEKGEVKANITFQNCH